MHLIHKFYLWVVPLAALATLPASAAGCGDTATDLRVPLRAVAQAYGEAYCARAFDCCTSAEIATRFASVDPPVTDEASCITSVGGVFGNEFVGDVTRAEGLGFATYLDDAMGRCLEHLRNDPCSELPRPGLLPADCESPTEPKVGLSGSCDHNFHCISGYCEGNMGATAGACRPMPALGDLCPERVCDNGLYCDTAATPEPRCAALRADGQECTSFLQCASGFCNEREPAGNTNACGPPLACTGLAAAGATGSFRRP